MTDINPHTARIDRLHEVDSHVSAGKTTIKRRRVSNKCVLDVYFLRGKLTEAQYKAGMKFRSAYLRAFLGNQGSDEREGRYRAAEISMLTSIDSERVVRAVCAVLSKSQQHVVVDICIHDNWPRTSGRTQTLIRSLDKMAEHLGIA